MQPLYEFSPEVIDKKEASVKFRWENDPFLIATGFVPLWHATWPRRIVAARLSCLTASSRLPARGLDQ